MAIMTEIDFKPGEQLFVFSDGLIEAADSSGEPFGLARLVAVLTSAPPARRFEAVRAGLNAHTGIAQSHDDVSLLLIGQGD